MRGEARRSLRPLPELEEELGLDFERYWRAVRRRWWLLVVGAAVGAVAGALATLGGSPRYSATAEVYLGQALVGGSLVSLAPTEVALASTNVTSGATIRAVAARVGLKPAKLSGHVTTSPVLGQTGTNVGAPTPIMAITVTGSQRRTIAAAADAFAAAAVRDVGPFQASKASTLKAHLNFDSSQLRALNVRLAAARAVQTEILADKTLTSTDRLIGIVNQNSVITQALAQQINLQQDTFQVQQQLTLTQDLETARVVTPAITKNAAATSRKKAAFIGALIGLAAGILATLLWEPLLPRRSEPRPQ